MQNGTKFYQGHELNLQSRVCSSSSGKKTLPHLWYDQPAGPINSPAIAICHGIENSPLILCSNLISGMEFCPSSHLSSLGIVSWLWNLESLISVSEVPRKLAAHWSLLDDFHILDAYYSDAGIPRWQDVCRASKLKTVRFTL